MGLMLAFADDAALAHLVIAAPAYDFSHRAVEGMPVDLERSPDA